MSRVGYGLMWVGLRWVAIWKWLKRAKCINLGWTIFDSTWLTRLANLLMSMTMMQIDTDRIPQWLVSWRESSPTTIQPSKQGYVKVSLLNVYFRRLPSRIHEILQLMTGRISWRRGGVNAAPWRACLRDVPAVSSHPLLLLSKLEKWGIGQNQTIKKREKGWDLDLGEINIMDLIPNGVVVSQLRRRTDLDHWHYRLLSTRCRTPLDFSHLVLLYVLLSCSFPLPVARKCRRFSRRVRRFTGKSSWCRLSIKHWSDGASSFAGHWSRKRQKNARKDVKNAIFHLLKN